MRTTARHASAGDDCEEPAFPARAVTSWLAGFCGMVVVAQPPLKVTSTYLPS